MFNICWKRLCIQCWVKISSVCIYSFESVVFLSLLSFLSYQFLKRMCYWLIYLFLLIVLLIIAFYIFKLYTQGYICSCDHCVLLINYSFYQDVFFFFSIKTALKTRRLFPLPYLPASVFHPPLFFFPLFLCPFLLNPL